MFIRALTDTRRAAALFIFALIAVYVAMPVFVDRLIVPNDYFIELAELSVVACAAIYIGYRLPVFDGRFRQGAMRIAIDARVFHAAVWGAFVAFLVITFATADSIPIVSAFQGNVSADDLSQQRGDFLKARVGVEAALLYLSTLFVSALLPYSLVRLFGEKSRLRYPLAVLLLAFAVSFLNKSLFLYIALPLLYVSAQEQRARSFRLLLIALGSVGLLYLVTVLAFGGQTAFDSVQQEPPSSSGIFFGAAYQAGGIGDFLIWRSVAVPMFTASDALSVFNESFNHQPLWGATSSFVATIFSLERVPFERLVFEHQWGWNDIANSNSVYITEAFVNFGWGGVVLFSLFVGQSLRWFDKSRDQAFKALWMIFCFSLFNGGLIGTLLSNGYALMFFIALFTTFKNTAAAQRFETG